MALLRAVHHPAAPLLWLAEPAVDVLRRVLVQNYLISFDAGGREVVRAREADPATADPSASGQRSNIIIQVATTDATACPTRR